MEKEQLYSQEQRRFEPLSGVETAEKISAIYELLGSKLGSRLVEPNVVLAIAGMKGLADIPWVELEREDFERLEQAEKKLADLGISVSFYSEKSKEAAEKGAVPVLMSLESMKGIERKTNTTKIPGVPLYDCKSGKEGLRQWGSNLVNSLETAQKDGKLPKEIEIEILFEGIMFGYPDQSIFDFEKCLREGYIQGDLSEADILSVAPEAKEYQGAVPEFDYFPEHKDNSEIVDYIKKARQILKEFYNTDWLKKIKEDKDFQAGRNKYKEALERGMEVKNEKLDIVVVKQIEDYSDLDLQEKVELLLVLGDFKKANEQDFESEEWYDGQPQASVDEEKIKTYEKLLEECGLVFEKKKETAKSRVARVEDNYEYVRNIERVRYILAKSREDIEKYKMAAQGESDKLLGEIYGFPQTSIEAFEKPGEIIEYGELPEDIRSSEAYSFLTFKLSRNNYREEFETAKKWADFVKKCSPKIYAEYIEYMKAVEGR